MSVTNQPRIEAYIGASGSGKGVSINARLRELQPKRLVIWDPRNEYGKHARPVTTVAALVADLKKAGAAGPIRVRVVPGSQDLAAMFALICKAVFAVGNLVFVAEELSDVTSASYAPPAWRRITTQGRHQGLHVLAAAQRPAQIDKSFLANCTFVRCFELAYDDDVATMAKQMRVPVALVMDLRTEEVKDASGESIGAEINALEYVRRERRLEAIHISARKGSTPREKRAPAVVGEPQKAPAKRAR